MELIPSKQLIKTAFGTTPIMALMLVTPIFLLTSKIHHFSFFLLWGAVSIAITFAWLFNIALLIYIKQNWTRTWVRIIIVASIMYFISFIIFLLAIPELEIDRTNIEIIRFTNILAVNTFIFILTDLIITKENKNKFELENANLKLANLEAEFKLLKDQINPHFLFNALSTAKALIKKQPELAEEYIIRLSEFLRASINNNRKTVPLKEELALCNEYISLNKIRFGDALIFENKLKIDYDNFSVPYFSILSLIENAIKHNTFTIENPLKISAFNSEHFIEIKNNKQLKFVIENSPKTGLRNLNDRYKLLNVPEVVIKETDDQFSVQIALIKK
jgi:two-component system, LytTR family, sensor kinase